MSNPSIQISLGSTPAELKLVLSGEMFAWLQENGRIWRLPQPCSPAQLFNFFVDNEPNWREWLEFMRLTPEEIGHIDPTANFWYNKRNLLEEKNGIFNRK